MGVWGGGGWEKWLREWLNTEPKNNTGHGRYLREKLAKNNAHGGSGNFFSFSQLFSYCCYLSPNDPAVVLWQNSFGFSESSWERNSSRGLRGIESHLRE